MPTAGSERIGVARKEAVTTPANSAPVVEEKQVGTHQYVGTSPSNRPPVTSSEVTKVEGFTETKPISAESVIFWVN